MAKTEAEKRARRKYNATPKAKRKRAENNRARRKAIREGRARKGDNTDLHHVNGNKGKPGRTVVRDRLANRKDNNRKKKKK